MIQHNHLYMLQRISSVLINADEHSDFTQTLDTFWEITYQCGQLEHEGLKEYTDQGLDITAKNHLLFYQF